MYTIFFRKIGNKRWIVFERGWTNRRDAEREAARQHRKTPSFLFKVKRD